MRKDSASSLSNFKVDKVKETSIFTVPQTTSMINYSNTNIKSKNNIRENQEKLRNFYKSNKQSICPSPSPWVDTKNTLKSEKKQDMKNMRSRYEIEVLPNLSESKSTLGRKLNNLHNSDKKHISK